MTFPTADMELTQIIVVSDLTRSRQFYVDVLGARLHREYDGTSVVLRFLDSWVLLVTGGPATPDKPGVELRAPRDRSVASHLWTIRVPDCHAAHTDLTERGAVFLTPPKDWGAEIRAFCTDPDGNLIEISEARS